MKANITNAIAPTHTSTRCNFNMKYLLLEASLCAQQEQMACTSVCVYAATLLGSRSRDPWCAGMTTSGDVVTYRGQSENLTACRWAEA